MMLYDQRRRFKPPIWAIRLYEQMSATERVVLAWLIALMFVSAIWFVIGYIGRNTELIAETGGIYSEAAVGQPRNVNPILAGANDLDVDISRLVYSSLFKLDGKLQLQKDLATDITISEDQKTYIVNLRTDVNWHDGQLLSADDVVFTIRSIQTPSYGSPLLSAFESVTIEKVDAHTVKFTLVEPYAPFISSLTVGIVPEHVWKNIAPENATLAEQMLKPIGSGPYRFLEIKTRRKTGEITEFNLVRNDAYYGTRPFIDEVHYRFFTNYDDSLKAIIAGEVDGLGFLPLQLRDELERRSSLIVQRLNLPQYFSLFFNQQDSTILADAGIRNALALAIDRTEIVNEALNGEGEPLHLPIPPGIFGFNDELSAPIFDLEAAKRELDEAGWQDVDGDGIREKNDQRLHLKITTTDWPEYVHTAEVIQKQWLKVGAETEIEHFGAGTIQQTIIRPRDYEILLFGEILSSIPDPYPFWHSTQTRSPGLNFSLFKNKEVDKLLEEARKTPNEDERREKYKAFQGIILDIKPALILYRPLYLFGTSKKVRGINPDLAALPADRFNNISQWHVKVKRVWK